ncbi:hypothetical protein MLD38_003839 [Melastoma candidum]|uniref:Uncharacterized protein n=1 Tax=Melastoma candidum TaxID=119954 RepID=A0ACB9S7P6_9MYRT|nr:hypothetical protein MLD38_003839 [Melastoma candidum]
MQVSHHNFMYLLASQRRTLYYLLICTILFPDRKRRIGLSFCRWGGVEFLWGFFPLTVTYMVATYQPPAYQSIFRQRSTDLATLQAVLKVAEVLNEFGVFGLF